MINAKKILAFFTSLTIALFAFPFSAAFYSQNIVWADSQAVYENEAANNIKVVTATSKVQPTETTSSEVAQTTAVTATTGTTTAAVTSTLKTVTVVVIIGTTTTEEITHTQTSATTVTTTTKTTTTTVTTAESKYEYLTYKQYSDHIEIIDCDSTVQEVVIPSEINGLPVTVIGNSAFYDCEKLTDIQIPEGIISIGKYAFYHTRLKSVKLPETLTEIKEFAFYNCGLLEQINLPEGLMGIEHDAFKYCGKLKNIHIPDTVTYIGDDAFSYCSALDNINIPENVTDIGINAFSRCTALEEFEVSENNRYYCDIDGVLFTKDAATLISYPNLKGDSYIMPEGVVNIAAKAFDGCGNLKSIELCDGLEVIEYCAFEDCESIEKIVLPDSVTEVSHQAFDSCKQLKEVVLSKNMSIITERMFFFCESLENIIIPESVTAIEDDAFSHSGLVSIEIPDNVKEMGTEVFYSCEKLESVKLPNTITELETPKTIDIYSKLIQSGFFEGCKSLTDVVLPESLTFIDDCTFKGCTSLKEIVIPKNVNRLGGGVFAYCSSLENVTFLSESSLSLTEAYGRLTELPEYPYLQGEVSYFYYGGFFENCTSLKEIVLPENIHYIEEGTFDGCTALDKVTILQPYCSIGSIPKNSDESVICGYEGSTAQSYAKENEFVFETLGESPLVTTAVTATTTAKTTTTSVTTSTSKTNGVIVSVSSIATTVSRITPAVTSNSVIVTVTVTSQTPAIHGVYMTSVHVNLEAENVKIDKSGQTAEMTLTVCSKEGTVTPELLNGIRLIKVIDEEGAEYTVNDDGTFDTKGINVTLTFEVDESVQEGEYKLSFRFYGTEYVDTSTSVSIGGIKYIYICEKSTGGILTIGNSGDVIVSTSVSEVTTQTSTTFVSVTQTSVSNSESGIVTTTVTDTLQPIGDSNGDNEIDVRDCAFIAMKIASGKVSELDETSDFNGDGDVNVRDAAALANALANGEIKNSENIGSDTNGMSWKEIYTDVILQHQYKTEMDYSLAYIDDDEIPELIIGDTGDKRLGGVYTIKNGSAVMLTDITLRNIFSGYTEKSGSYYQEWWWLEKSGVNVYNIVDGEAVLVEELSTSVNKDFYINDISVTEYEYNQKHEEIINQMSDKVTFYSYDKMLEQLG